MSRNFLKHLREDDRKLSLEDKEKEEKLRTDVFAAVTNWFDSDCKVALPTELEKEVGAVLSLRYAEILRSPGHRATIKHVADEVQHISSRVSSLASALQEKTNALLAILHKCGIALLPDEVLTTIFGFVIELTVPENTKLTSHKWRAAVKLSHVNRRFRSVMLSCPRFWANMNSSRIMAAACLPRTKGLPLSVNLTIEDHIGENAQTFEPILAELLPVRELWGRLHLKFNSTHSYKSRWGSGCEFDTLIKHMLYHMDAPMLQELSIEYKDYGRSRHLKWDWSQWKTPNLRRLELKSYFPLSLPGLANITSLDLSICVDDAQMAHILKEISQISNLQDLAVEFLNTNNYPPCRVLEKLEFLRVQRLKIKTTLAPQATDGNMAIKRLIFSSMFFPNAIDFQLRIEGCDNKSGSRSYQDAEGAFILHFNKEICCIFRHIHQFPRLDRLSLDISSWNDREYKVHARLALPLNMLHNLKDLTLHCNTHFDISEPDVPDEKFYLPESANPPRVAGNAFPALSTVTLDVFEASAAARWLGEYLVEMRGRGKWDEFRELKVVERVGKELQTTLFPGDDALQWCKNIIARNKAWGTSESVLL